MASAKFDSLPNDLPLGDFKIELGEYNVGKPDAPEMKTFEIRFLDNGAQSVEETFFLLPEGATTKDAVEGFGTLIRCQFQSTEAMFSFAEELVKARYLPALRGVHPYAEELAAAGFLPSGEATDKAIESKPHPAEQTIKPTLEYAESQEKPEK